MDICSQYRIRHAAERHGERFIHQVFTEREIAYCSTQADPYPSYTARFAAKEAVMKLLGKGVWVIPFTNVEVGRGAEGRPFIILTGKAEELARELGIKSMDVTISHEKDGYAVAFVTALADPKKPSSGR